VPIRVWDYVDGDLVEREIAIGEPVECGPFGLWWVVEEHPDLGPVLRLSRDAGGRDMLPTPKEAAGAERDAALEELRVLKALLSKPP